MSDKPILFQAEMVRALLDGTKTQTRRVLKIKGHRDFSVFGVTETAGHDWTFRRKDLVWEDYTHAEFLALLPFQIGDRLWVREAWRPKDGFSNWDLQIDYPADNSTLHFGDEIDLEDWRFPKASKKGNVPSIFMPRWASRLTLEVTDVRIQRVQEISGGDATDEGIEQGQRPNWHHSRPFKDYSGKDKWTFSTQESFKTLWNSINAKPKPVGGKTITYYQSFPWDGESRTETYRGKPHIITANPWVAAYSFIVHKHNIDQDQS